jgi:hypothetical protein
VGASVAAALCLGAGLAGGSDAAPPFGVYGGYGGQQNQPEPMLDTDGPSTPARGSATGVRLTGAGVIVYSVGPFKEDVRGAVSFGTANAVAAKTAKKRKVTFGRKTFRAKAGRKARVRVQLSRKNRLLVRRYRSVRVRARLVATDAAKNDSFRSYYFTLKRPR